MSPITNRTYSLSTPSGCPAFGVHRRIYFQTDNTRMFTQRKDDPITKMFIKRNENTIFRNGSFQNLSIIGSCLTNFRSTPHIVPFIP